MAISIREDRPVRGAEAIAEAPDGTRRYFIPFPTPLHDDSGKLAGAVNILVDITDRKRAEAELNRRYVELEALHTLTLAVNSAVSSEDIHAQAIDAIMNAVHPDRAALLLIDTDGVMRFKAWRGLSEDYRVAVTGHSPWNADDPEPQPVLVEDALNDPSLADFRDLILGEGIGALAFIPLTAQGRLVGKFMLYHDNAHVFSPEEVQVAQTVANNLATGLARRHAESEREQLVVELQTERERVSNVISNVPGVVWEAYGRPDSAQQRIDFVSEHVEDLTGYTVEQWLGTPNFWLTIVHPEDRERAASEAAAVYNAGGDGRSEFRWVARDGRVIWVEAQSTVVKDQAGQTIGMRGVTMDISVRKEAEQAVRSVEAQLSLVTNAVPALIAYVDSSHCYVYNNDAYEDWFGLSAADLAGKHIRDVLGKKVYRKRLPYIRRALAGERVRYEDEIPYETGTRWVLSEAIPHRVAGKIDGFVSVISDITERKKREEEERRARQVAERSLSEEAAINRIAELLRTTLDLDTLCQVAVTEATRVTATEFGIMAVRSGEEARVTASLGVSDAALAPFLDLAPGNPTALARATFEGASAFSTKGRLLIGTAKFLRESGASRFAVVPLIARGVVVGAIEIASRSRAPWTPEDRAFLRRIADHIALAVSNAQAYQAIEEAYKRRDEGVRALSHEIRTPLTALKGFSQLALRHVERGAVDPERLKDSLEEIASASERLVRVAEQMLSASSVESGLTRMRKERVPLGKLLRRAVAEFTAEQRPCPVILEPVPRAVLYVDQQLVRQVVWNLLSNAMKYSPPGEPIIVRASKKDDTATILVIDRGPGVPLADVESLFEKFQTGSDGGVGLGLGLYLARQVVEAHTGKLFYQPGDGGGAVFSFTLPRRRFRT
jgi:PAS domain S-box-containing protein